MRIIHTYKGPSCKELLIFKVAVIIKVDLVMQKNSFISSLIWQNLLFTSSLIWGGSMCILSLEYIIITSLCTSLSITIVLLVSHVIPVIPVIPVITVIV